MWRVRKKETVRLQEQKQNIRRICDPVKQLQAQTWASLTTFPGALLTLKPLSQSPAVRWHYTYTVTHRALASGSCGACIHDPASSVTPSADDPGGRQRCGQDLSVGSVWPGQVHPRVLHLHRWHWLHSESWLSVLYTPSPLWVCFFASLSSVFSLPLPLSLCDVVDLMTCHYDGLFVLKSWHKSEENLSPFLCCGAFDSLSVFVKCCMNQWRSPVWGVASCHCIYYNLYCG